GARPCSGGRRGPGLPARPWRRAWTGCWAISDRGRASPASMSLRSRFAPSPTGELHLGNARTALLAWLHARRAGGRLVMRVEDLDEGRVRQRHLTGQLED